MPPHGTGAGSSSPLLSRAKCCSSRVFFGPLNRYRCACISHGMVYGVPCELWIDEVRNARQHTMSVAETYDTMRLFLVGVLLSKLEISQACLPVMVEEDVADTDVVVQPAMRV